MAENKWTCPACGQENDGKFCVGCGAAMPEAAEAVAEATEAVEEAKEEVAAASEAVAAEAAPAAEAAAEAAEAAEAVADPDEFVPQEPDHSSPVYDSTPVEQITEPVSEPVAAESVAPAYAPIEPAKVDPDNFVPAPIQPQTNNCSEGSSASSASPKPAGYTPALVGMILAIAGIVLLWIPILGPGLAIAGLILSIVAKSKGYAGGMGTAGLIISIASIVISIIGTVGCFICITNM